MLKDFFVRCKDNDLRNFIKNQNLHLFSIFWSKIKAFFAFLTFSIFCLFDWVVLTNEPCNLFPISKLVVNYRSIFKSNLGDFLFKIMSKKVVKGKVWQGNDFQYQKYTQILAFETLSHTRPPLPFWQIWVPI